MSKKKENDIDPLSILWKGIETMGDFVEKGVTEVTEGVVMLGKEAMQTISEVDPTGKVIDVIKFFNLRVTIAEALYPCEDLCEKLKKNSEDAEVLLDYLEQIERQRQFRYSLMNHLSLTPFGKDISKKIQQAMNDIREEDGYRGKLDEQLKVVKEKIHKLIEIEIENEGPDERIGQLYIALIRAKLFGNDHDNLENMLDTLDEISGFGGMKKCLRGRYYAQIREFEKAEMLLKKAMSLECKYADDYLTALYEDWKKDCPRMKQKIESKMCESFSHLGYSSEVWGRISNLPSSIIALKWKQINKILNNGN